jgi:hypothetical protein
MESYIVKDGLFRYGITWKSAIGLTLLFNAFISAAQPEKVRFNRDLLSTGQGAHDRTGRVFNDIDGFCEAIIELLNETQPSELQAVFRHWIERMKWVLANNGDDRHE